MVLPEQLQIDSFVYWADAFNSDLDFWKNQTAFMRDALGITEETVSGTHNYVATDTLIEFCVNVGLRYT